MFNPRTLAAPAVLLLASGSALADVEDITGAGTTAVSYAAAIAGVMIAIWAAKLAYRKFFGS